jgi:vitamin K-dependent gamma-carboxylase
MMKSLFRPVDAAVLIYFRIGAGILLSQELINGLVIGKFDQYVAPAFNFSYLFFDWVKPWPYWGMVVHYALTIFAGFAVAFNFHYRVFSVILFLGHLLLFLFEQTEYINHSYLYCLVSFWMMLLPLHNRRTTRPAWMLYLIIFHMALAYFFGGVAKLNADWLQGTPMDIFLANRRDGPLGFLYDAPWAPFLYSYGGVLFDLLIVPLLAWRRTRLPAFVVAVGFHLSNVAMFGLATFPWFSIFLSTMFFDPSFPRRIPVLRHFLPWGIERVPEVTPDRRLVALLAAYVAVHVLLPFRHLLYPGVTSWTEQGHTFAWRMMLRHKEGSVMFFVKSQRDGHLALPDPRQFITPRQLADMTGKPDLILQFAHFLRDRYEREWKTPVAVYASARVSLNGRPRQELIAPGTDLAREERGFAHYKWINQLQETPSSFRFAESD